MRVVESPAPLVHPLYVAVDEFDIEDYTDADTDALTERIRCARSVPAEWARLREGESTREQIERHRRRMDEQTAALVAVEVRKAQAEALRDAAAGMGEWGEEPVMVAGDAFDEDTWCETTVGDWLRARADDHEKEQSNG